MQTLHGAAQGELLLARAFSLFNNIHTLVTLTALRKRTLAHQQNIERCLLPLEFCFEISDEVEFAIQGNNFSFSDLDSIPDRHFQVVYCRGWFSSGRGRGDRGIEVGNRQALLARPRRYFVLPILNGDAIRTQFRVIVIPALVLTLVLKALTLAAQCLYSLHFSIDPLLYGLGSISFLCQTLL